MGRVLADVAAYEEEPHRLIFTFYFVCVFRRRVMYFIPIVLKYLVVSGTFFPPISLAVDTTNHFVRALF